MIYLDSLMMPSYTHIVKPRLKHIYLSFDSSGQLVVKSPRVSQKEIERVLIKKAKWIEDSRRKISQKRGKALRGDSGERLSYLGMEYIVNYFDDGGEDRIRFSKSDGFSIYGGGLDVESIDIAANEFYKNRAKRHIPAIVERYTEIMGLHPTKLSFRKAKRQWGSCSAKNAISINYLAMKLPLDAIEYIVVHELAHIRYKNHQMEFWRLVESYMPDYKSRQKELKNYIL